VLLLPFLVHRRFLQEEYLEPVPHVIVCGGIRTTKLYPSIVTRCVSTNIPEGIDTVEVVTAQSLVLDEAQSFVESKRSLVGDFGLQDDFITAIFLHHTDGPLHQLGTLTPPPQEGDMHRQS